MATIWGPTLYSFMVRVTDSKSVKFECGFSYDENYNDNIIFQLSFFPLVKNGTAFKFFIDNLDISYAILLLQNIISNNVKEGIIVNRPSKKVFIKKESDHMYRLYFLTQDNNVSIDMTSKEVYNLLSIFEMLKANYINMSCLVYAGAIKYINTNKKNTNIQTKQITQPSNKEILESVPLSSIINNSRIETTVPLEQVNLDQAVKEITSQPIQRKKEEPSPEISDMVDDVFGQTEQNNSGPVTEHVGNNKTVDDLAKAIFGS